MHICFFIGGIANKGGTERMTVSLANYLLEMKHQVSIINLVNTGESAFVIDDRIKIYPLFLKKTNLTQKWPLIVFRLYKLVRREKIQILIDVDAILSMFSLPVKIFDRNLKVVTWEHFNYKANLGIKRRDYARYLAKKYSDAIVTLTEQDKSFYLEDRRCRIPVYAIPNFLESDPIMQARLDNKVVLAVGRFTNQKGFDILIDVWRLLKNDHLSEGWVLNIVGDGEDKEVIRQTISTLGISSSVKIIDATDKISDYYESASIYIMTSRFEGLPMVLIEAKSFGLPIVSFDCLTGPRDIIEHQIDGYLTPMNDKSKMVEYMLSLMSDENLRKRMGQMSLINYSKLNKNIILDKWNKLLANLL